MALDDYQRCDGCKSNRLIRLWAKLPYRSQCSIEYLAAGSAVIRGDELPEIIGVCGFEEINMEICLTCGKVQGNFPVVTNLVMELKEQVE